MATIDTSWYDVVGSAVKKDKLVQCEKYASALSLKEMEDVEIKCAVPMIKGSYAIKDRADNTVKEGAFSLPAEGVMQFTLKDYVPFAELTPYETRDADYHIVMAVTLITGDEISGFRVFVCNIRAGEYTTEIPDKLNLIEALDAIPVAKPGMTEDELRNICLRYFELETQFPYRFKEDFVYEIVSQKRLRRLEAGKVYGGLPYITRGAGNIYRVAEFYDPETGYLDTNGDIFKNIRHFGNACSGGASTAWARVVTSAYLGYTMFTTQANGYLPVGPYRYSKPEVTKFIKKKLDPNGYDCSDICQENGEQVMYESYAAMKPADGVCCCGHVRMNYSNPVVVRNEDGTIDGEKSYTTMIEQICYVNNPNCLRIAPDGTHYTCQGFVDIKYTFANLFQTHYIPFTFAEFQDPSRVEVARVVLSVEPEWKWASITSNYPISDVFSEVNGKRYVFRNEEFFRKEVHLGDIFPEEALVDGAKISCRLYNGETHELDTLRSKK